MRVSRILAVLSLVAAGCATTSQPQVASKTRPEHPMVVVSGIDGTQLAGELLNGSITIISGQGELMLLTDHLHSVTIAPDVDKMDSDSVKVSGKIKDTQFMLKSEHGVFTLSKDRLRRIEFIGHPSPAPAPVTADAKIAALKAGTAPK